jgi:hypothetical protein
MKVWDSLWTADMAKYWLVVSNMAFIFPNIWDDPIWLSYFSGGLKPPTRYYPLIKFISKLICKLLALNR